MRQIVLDTETTGIGPDHRIIEIGCKEMVNRTLTGAYYHVYLNPQRAVDEGAFRVHGISNAFLKDKPLFKNVMAEFLEFIAGAQLIIHNAPFDVGFLNTEFAKARHKKTLEDYCDVFDTLVLARKKHPGQRNNLDALCKRYDIDNTNRTLHGALLDAEILAFVYLAMTGGQIRLFADMEEGGVGAEGKTQAVVPLHLANPVVIKASEEELAQHQAFVDLLKKTSSVN